MATADDLTVYGRPVGSLWDRLSGGRYELVAIADRGGLGLAVSLRDVVEDDIELTIPVSDMGRDFVSVVDAPPAPAWTVPIPGDLTGTTWTVGTVVGRCDYGAGCWMVGTDGIDLHYYPSELGERIPDEAPAEDEQHVHDLTSESCSCGGFNQPAVSEPVNPSEDDPERSIGDGEGVHLNLPARCDWRPFDQSTGVCMLNVGHTQPHLIEFPVEPAPSPLLSAPTAPPFWRHKRLRHIVVPDHGFDLDQADPDEWQRVAVIPWDLITDLRWAHGDTGAGQAALDAILDAAGGGAA